MRNLAVFSISLFLFFGTSYGNKPDKERISEIASVISESPGLPFVRATNRTLWNQVASERYAAKFVSDAEKTLEEPIPNVDDSLYQKISPWEQASAKRRNNLLILVWAECIENKGRFIPRIAEYLDAISSQTTWVNPYHDRVKFGNIKGLYRSIDLNCGQAAIAVAVTLDALKGKLPKRTVEYAMSSIQEKVFDVYLGVCDNPSEYKKRRCSWFFDNANWNSACHAYVLGAALRVVEDKMERARFIEGAERGYPRYFNSFTSEGFCTEGPSYWNYGFGQFLRLGLMVRLATGGKVDFFSHPKARKAMDYAYGFQINEGVVAQIGDSTAAPSPKTITLGELIWPDICTTYSKLPWYRNGLEAFQLRTAYLGALNIKKPVTKMKLPIRTFFEEAQMLICRQNIPSLPNMAASIKGFHNGVSHNHNDVGVYEIVLDGVRIVHDPGNKKYDLDTFGPKRYNSVIRNSYGHNVPVVAGNLQEVGEKYGARLVSTKFSDNLDSIVFDLTGAYAVKELQKLHRRMSYSRNESFVEIEDMVAFQVPSSFETPVTTYGDVIEGKGPNEFIVAANQKGVEKRLRFIVDAGNAKWHTKKEVFDNSKYGKLVRFAIVLDNPVRSAAVKLRFVPDSDDL